MTETSMPPCLAAEAWSPTRGGNALPHQGSSWRTDPSSDGSLGPEQDELKLDVLEWETEQV